jgi:serine/threonine-protein kinase RsbW
LSDRTNLLVVCRELLKNAVVHGNRNDAAKTVTLRLHRLSGGQFRVEIEDGGDGFDTASVERSSGTGEGTEHKKGYALIGALVHRIVFNTRGNRVTVFVEPQESVAR